MTESTVIQNHYAHTPGHTHPLGARPDSEGINFAIFSQHATGVELLLFDRADAVRPFQVITLDPDDNRSYAIWHVHVTGLRAPVWYAYRVHGPTGPVARAHGHRFDPGKVLIDPYSLGVDRTLWRRGDACLPGGNLATSLRSVAIDLEDYDWEGDRPLGRPMRDTVIYELHVGGFTRSPASGVTHPGTFLGVVEKIPYLRSLGVTAVELLPVADFDASEVREFEGRRLGNYWGYSTAAFFAPHDGYCVSSADAQQIREFRDMVKALHAAGIEVILDVVFNHTDEGNHLGPLFSFAGLDNSSYYHLNPADRRYYLDYSGCGNSLMGNEPIVAKLIVECLEFWVRDMHVDGFRFDEATVLARASRAARGTPDTPGALMESPPLIWQIELEDALAETKIIAEAWDAGGAYEVGRYPGYRWAEWNGRFRDTVRRFVRGDPGLVGEVATRLGGSADLYGDRGQRPINGVNFVTCHDGFTLADLVSYNTKRNWANGECNRDGSDDNLSWNCGMEGPTPDPEITALRTRQIKNFATLLLLSRGVPMITAGDEVRRTQRGNNNAYCQDNELSWFDWSLPDRNAGLLRFWRKLLEFRRDNAVLRQPEFYTGQPTSRGLPDVAWHGTTLGAPGWDDPGARALACTLAGLGDQPDLHVMMNMYWRSLDFQVPPPAAGRTWRRVIDTNLPAGEDIVESCTGPVVTTPTCPVAGRSIIVLAGHSIVDVH